MLEGKKKLLFVFGTRPEAIKVAPVYLRFKEDSEFDVECCVTGQHRQMLDQALGFFGISPEIDLNIMKANQTLNSIFAEVIAGLDRVLMAKQYSGVFVHGDTTTSSAAALCAFHRRVPVLHVEAGLRTFDLQSPWPEELNRRISGLCSSLHFAPTEMTKANLVREGVSEECISVTGNTVVDALERAARILEQRADLTEKFEKDFGFLAERKKLILVTGHRRENFGSKLENLCKGLLRLSERGDVQIVYPVHLNPSVREPVQRVLGGAKNVYLTEPLEYPQFVWLMKKSHLILTDSGGIQEEAPTFRKPVLVMRETTERPEALQAGTARLVGTESDRIYEEAARLLENTYAYTQMQSAGNPYGDGKASDRILEFVKKWNR